MNHNCSYWNGNFRFFLEYAIRIMLQSQTHGVDYTINSSMVIDRNNIHTMAKYTTYQTNSLRILVLIFAAGWPARVALPRLLKAGCGACRTVSWNLYQITAAHEAFMCVFWFVQVDWANAWGMCQVLKVIAPCPTPQPHGWGTVASDPIYSSKWAPVYTSEPQSPSEPRTTVVSDPPPFWYLVTVDHISLA